MRIYKKNPNRTAQEIANEIKKSDRYGFWDTITKEGYDWLYMHANSIAQLVEELLDNKYYIVITREKDNGLYTINVQWNEIDSN